MSTWVSAIPEMVVPGQTGFLVHERDAMAAADALERLYLDPDEATRMGRAGKSRVEDQFRLDRLLDRLTELFLER